MKYIPNSVVAMWLMTAILFAMGARPGSQPATPLEELDQTKTWKFDEYSNIRFNDEKARLDAFAIQLKQEPGAQGYIIGYGGKICYFNEALARAKRAKDYLNFNRGIDPQRITTVNGGYREQVGAELYVRPAGASDPPAQPTISKCTKPKSVSGRR